MQVNKMAFHIFFNMKNRHNI